MSTVYIALQRLINIILAIITFFIGFRILFRLLAANPSTPFVSWIYSISDRLVYPFTGIFPNPSISNIGVLDVVAIISLLAYALVAYLITLVLDSAFNAYFAQRNHPHVIDESYPRHIH